MFIMCRIAKCLYCNNQGVVAIALKNRGGRNGYLCEAHASRYGDESYYNENSITRGTTKKHGFTFSMELEMSSPTEIMRAELLNCGFMPTQDSTTDTEFKSPIWQSLNPLPKKFNTIEKLLNEGEGAITRNEGTHFHVGHREYINPTTISYLKRFYHSLFVPLSDIMLNNSEANKRLFGRDFCYWARQINDSSNPTEHSNFINLQHDYTIEYRLCKFVDANQYMNVIKFCKDITNTVINNFIKHFEGSTTEQRRHKAQVTANKIVKLYCKYANINNENE